MRKRLKNHFIPHEGNDYKPHFVRERNIIGLGLLVIAIFTLAFSLKSLVTKNPDLLSAVITGVLVDLTNSDRLRENLSPLEFSPVLASAAQLKASDMAEKSYFAHTSPEGRSPWYWFSQSHYDFLYAGENLAVNFADSEDVVRAWMDSPGHRANILSDKFTQIGIAIAPGTYKGETTLFVVQLFGQPLPESRTPKPIVQATSTPQVQVIAEDKMFIAVKNNNESAEVAGAESPIEAVAPQSSIIDKAITSPKVVLETIYIALAVLVLIALLLFIWMKPKNLHTKNVVYTVLVLILIIIFLYLSSTYLFPTISIE